MYYTDSDWYVMMATNQPLVDPKVEMLPELCEEEECHSATNLPHHTLLASTLRWVGMNAGIRVIPCFSTRYKTGKLVCKENEVPP